jgi:hypothetical protein
MNYNLEKNFHKISFIDQRHDAFEVRTQLVQWFILENSSHECDKMSWSKCQTLRQIRFCRRNNDSINRCLVQVKSFDCESFASLCFTTFANMLMKLIVERKFLLTFTTLMNFWHFSIDHLSVIMIFIFVEKITEVLCAIVRFLRFVRVVIFFILFVCREFWFLAVFLNISEIF